MCCSFIGFFTWISKNLDFLRQIFAILTIHTPSLGSCEVPQQIWSRSVQPFWRISVTNKQTSKGVYFSVCSLGLGKKKGGSGEKEKGKRDGERREEGREKWEEGSKKWARGKRKREGKVKWRRGKGKKHAYKKQHQKCLKKKPQGGHWS